MQAAKTAFPAWSRSAVGSRARVMFKLQQLIWENKASFSLSSYNSMKQPSLSPFLFKDFSICGCSLKLLVWKSLQKKDDLNRRFFTQDELAKNVSLEQGKTIADAHGDVFRGLGRAFTARQPYVHLYPPSRTPPHTLYITFMEPTRRCVLYLTFRTSHNEGLAPLCRGGGICLWNS